MESYIKISRLDHVIKQIFIVPGIFIALIYTSYDNINFLIIFLGFISSILTASSNYVINEYLDRNFDKHHPLKNSRTLVKKKLTFKNIILYYFILIFISLLISLKINIYFFITNIIFIISGIIYNVKPFRFKDKVYFDVLTESLNNPIRLFLGWFMIIDNMSILPPISFLLFYWFSGGFLMSSKRLSEIIFFEKFSNTKKNLVKYRPSYKHYNKNNLTLACIVYLMLVSFNSAIFLLKYREELILLYPIIILLFSAYFYLSIELPYKAVFPEKVYLNKYIIILTFFSFFLFFILFYFDLPLIENLIQKKVFS
jgi:4-hydroxybenzoate polyprenyltransferase